MLTVEEHGDFIRILAVDQAVIKIVPPGPRPAGEEFILQLPPGTAIWIRKPKPVEAA